MTLLKKTKQEGSGEESARVKRQKRDREIAVRRAEHFAVADSSSSSSNNVKVGKSNGATITSTPSGMPVPLPNQSGFASQSEEDAGIQGPFSIAFQIMANSEETRRRREKEWDEKERGQGDLEGAKVPDHLLDDYDRTLADVMRPPVVNSGDGKRTDIAIARRPGPIDSLLELSVRALTAPSTWVQLGKYDLGYTTTEARALVAGALARARHLDSHAAILLAQPGGGELQLPECSNIDEDTLRRATTQVRSAPGSAEGVKRADMADVANTLLDATLTPLRVLKLDNCGHAVTPVLAKEMCAWGAELEVLQLGGCYKLTDDALSPLMDSCVSLQTLSLTANSRLGGPGMTALGLQISRGLLELCLDHCTHLQDDDLLRLQPMSLNNIGEDASAMSQHAPPLQRLSLNGLVLATDASIGPLIRTFGPSLKALCLGKCTRLTGEMLHVIRASCGPRLEELDLAHFSDASSVALLGLFLRVEYSEHNVNAGRRSDNATDGIGPLKKLRLTGLAGMTDDVLMHVTGSAVLAAPDPFNEDGAEIYTLGEEMEEGVKEEEEGPPVLPRRAYGVLQQLDVGGCSSLSSKAAVVVAKDCAASLRLLDMSFCRGIQNEALSFLTAQCSSLERLSVWGCTQLNEVFFNSLNNRNFLVVGNDKHC